MANIPISSFTAAANATGIGMSGFSLTGANAQSMLDLAGTWNTSGTPTGIKINVTDTASNAASLLADLQVGGTSRFYVTKAGSGYFAGNVGIGTTTPGVKLTVRDGNISSVVSTYNATARYGFGNPARTDDAAYIEYTGAGDFTGSLIFATNGTVGNVAATEKMRVTGAGNVGIGTNSPGALLDVNGTARAGNFRVNAGGSVTGAGMWGIDTILAFNTGSTERMRIDSVGNTGIGTATPTTKLHVEGGAYTALRLASNTGVSAELYGRPGAGDDSAQIQFYTSAGVLSSIFGSIGGSLRLFTNGANERMRILSAGEVLVGKTAAGVGTDGAQFITGGFSGFSAPGTTALFLNRNTSDGTILEFGRNGVSAATMGLTSSALTVSTAGTERMRIESTGAIVLPKLTLSTDTPFVTGANINSGANSLAMGGSGTGVVSSFTNNTERMRVKANGQVRFIPLAAAPAGPEAGDVYYDSTTNKLRCYNGTTWNDLF